MSKKLINTFIESMIRDITTLGGLPFFIAVMLFLFLLEGFNNIVLFLLIGLIIMSVVAVGIRLIYYKPRPKELPKNTWIERIEASSIPSVHVARAWFLAFLFGNFFYNSQIWILLIITALAICYSRIHMKRHAYWDMPGCRGRELSSLSSVY